MHIIIIGIKLDFRFAMNYDVTVADADLER